MNFNFDIFTGKRKLCWQSCTSIGASQKTKLSRTDKNNKKYNLAQGKYVRTVMFGIYTQKILTQYGVTPANKAWRIT